jgi:hypothetical protein
VVSGAVFKMGKGIIFLWFACITHCQWVKPFRWGTSGVCQPWRWYRQLIQ